MSIQELVEEQENSQEALSLIASYSAWVAIQDPKQVENALNGKGYNPYRDGKGRFAPGPKKSKTGGGSKKSKSSEKSKTYDESKDKEAFFKQFVGFKKPKESSSTDRTRSFYAEFVAEKMGYNNNKPVRVEYPSDRKPKLIYRGWDEEKHVDAFVENATQRMSAGVSGSGVYFSTSKDEATSYSNRYDVLVTTFSLKRDAKGVDLMDLAADSSREGKKNFSYFDKKIKSAKESGDKERVQELQDIRRASIKLHTDYGAYAMSKGYDYISVEHTGREHIVILNKGKVEYGF